MYLNLKDKKKVPKDIFLNCPYNFSNNDAKKVFSCNNCGACIPICPKGAIYFSSKGVVSIDQNKCDGCGKCAEFCENNAIIMKNNKAYKCDLCSTANFAMYCYNNNKDTLKLIDDTPKYIKEKIYNKYLGYRLREDYKIIKKINNNIVDTDKGKLYIIDNIILSLGEVEIINNVLDNYKLKQEVLEDIDPIKIKSELEEELVNYCYSNNLELEKDQFDYILKETFQVLYNYGPISELLNSYLLEEITIFGKNKPVYVYHRHYGWLETNIEYTSSQILKDLINKLAWYSNKYITLKNPILDTYLKDNSRLNAIIPPVSDFPSLTIRKFTEKPFTIDDLLKLNTISKEALVFLSLAFLTESNIIIAGNTGSGKTTTLNTLLSFIPEDERFVIVEEVREINIPHKHKVFTLINPEQNITINNLILNTLRMRPDRVVIGEVRSKEESKAIIESMLCGQAKGTYTTFHAQSAKDAISRLGSYDILLSDLSVIDLIIIQKRYNKYIKGKSKDLRNIMEITEVLFIDNNIKLNVLYEYSINKNKLIKKNDPIKLLDKFKLAFGIKNLSDYKKLIKKKQNDFNNTV